MGQRRINVALHWRVWMSLSSNLERDRRQEGEKRNPASPLRHEAADFAGCLGTEREASL